MTAPRLEAVYFAPRARDPLEVWPRLVRVLRRSAARWCPDWQVHIEALPTPDRRPGVQAAGALDNTVKLEAWQRILEAAPDGDRIAFVDADLMVTGPLDPIWDKPFDVAYTDRVAHCPCPINAGVIFVRVSAASRRFFSLWVEENARIVSDTDYGRHWRRKYAGWNQASLGKVLEDRGDEHPATVIHVPCREWNSEDTSWHAFDRRQTRLVHIKSWLRLAVFGKAAPPTGSEPIVALWRQHDEAAS